LGIDLFQGLHGPFKCFEFIAHFYWKGNIKIFGLKGVLLPHYFSAFSEKAFREKSGMKKYGMGKGKNFPGMVNRRVRV
jgi:hypothetical protein